MQEIKQLSRRAEMVAAGPAMLAGGSGLLADPIVIAMRSVLRRAPAAVSGARHDPAGQGLAGCLWTDAW